MYLLILFLILVVAMPEPEADDDEVEDVLIGGGGGGRLSVKERFSLLSILSDLKWTIWKLEFNLNSGRQI